MKEPWKKTCNGKVIITLNDEKTTPTEVEVPVDLNWGGNQYEKKSSSKTVVLVGVLVILGLTLITLFKVQNLVYSTNYLTWRMQNLESSVGDSNDDIKLMKYKLSLEEDETDASNKLPQPQKFIDSKSAEELHLNVDNDLKLSESQSHKQLTSNSLESSESSESKKESEAKDSGSSQAEAKDAKDAKEPEYLNDASNHPNPADPENLLKSIVETFDFLNNPRNEDQLIEDTLKFLNVPKDNFEIVELNKMQDHSSELANSQEELRPPMLAYPAIRNKPQTLPRDILFHGQGPMPRHVLLGSNMKIFQLGDKPDAQQQNGVEEVMKPPKETRSMFDIFKSHKFSDTKTPILPLSGLSGSSVRQPQDQSVEEENPKFLIHRINMKVRSFMPQEEVASVAMEVPAPHVNSDFEVIRMHQMPPQEGQDRDIDARRLNPQSQQAGLPEPQFISPLFPIQEFLNSVIKRIEEDEAVGQQRFESVSFHDSVPKMLVPPANQAPDNYYAQNAQEQQQQQQQQQQHQQQPSHDVEVSRVPVHTMEVSSPYHMVNHMATADYREGMSEVIPQQPQQVPQEVQEAQPVQQQQQQPPQQPQQQQQDEPRAMPRSTKLNPVDSAWNISNQYSTETVQN